MELEPIRLAQARLSSFAGEGWRHLSPNYNPLSGEGARLQGGRYNPPGSFPVLYLCSTRPCAVAELRKLGERQAIGVEGYLPRHLYRYAVDIEGVLDLTDPGIRSAIGIGHEVLVDPDRTACQELGATAHALGIRALLVPSATGVDDVLVVFVQHVGLGRLEPTLAEEWRTVGDLSG